MECLFIFFLPMCSLVLKSRYMSLYRNQKNVCQSQSCQNNHPELKYCSILLNHFFSLKYHSSDSYSIPVNPNAAMAVYVFTEVLIETF